MLNIHPAVVHLPIGLLTVYSIIEILRFKKIQERSYIFYIKAVLVIVGFFGAIGAFLTGDMIEHAFVGTRALVNVHSNFALATLILYGIIGASYLIVWFQKESKKIAKLKNKTLVSLWKKKLLVANFLQKGPVLVVLSVIALICISITGALGGAIAYGPDADPFVSLVYGLFF